MIILSKINIEALNEKISISRNTVCTVHVLWHAGGSYSDICVHGPPAVAITHFAGKREEDKGNPICTIWQLSPGITSKHGEGEEEKEEGDR